MGCNNSSPTGSAPLAASGSLNTTPPSEDVLPLDMSQSEIKAFLEKHQFFKHLSGGNLSKAASCFKPVRVPMGGLIVKRLSASDSVFLLAQGECNVLAEDENGDRKILKTLKKNDLMGEFGMINNVPRTMDIAAATNVVALALDQKTYHKTKSAIHMNRLSLVMQANARDIMTTSLKNVDFLANITLEQKQLVGKLFKTIFVPAGTTLCEEGQSGDTFYVLDDGLLVVTTMDKNGLPVELSRLKPGSSFGEIALLEDSPRSASIVSVKESVMFTLGRNEFKDFLELVPSLKVEMEDKLRERAAVTVVTRDIPFVESVDKNTLFKLADLATTRRYLKPGTKIIKEGDTKPLKFCIITQGYVHVNVGGKRVRTLGVGEYFGEVSLVSSKPFSATVVTAGDEAFIYLEIDQKDFKPFL